MFGLLVRLLKEGGGLPALEKRMPRAPKVLRGVETRAREPWEPLLMRAPRAMLLRVPLRVPE